MQVIALSFALAGLLAVTLAALAVALLSWRAEVKEGKHLRDRLEAQDAVSDELVVQRDRAMTDAATAKHVAEQERAARQSAEKQRNEAEARMSELLAKHIKGATNDEIRVLTTDAFRSPLSVRPAVPEAGAVAADRDALIDPFL